MSAISSNQSLFQYFQSLNTGQGATANTGATAVQPCDDATGSTQSVHNGHHHRQADGAFFKQVQSAVTSALQSAQSGGSSSDANQVIENAIAQVLQNQQNGGSAATDQTTTTSAADGESNTNTAGAADGSSSAKNAFAQLLQSNGVSPQQFSQDFLAAIQSAQNGGSVDPSNVLSSFPAGSSVDTLG